MRRIPLAFEKFSCICRLHSPYLCSQTCLKQIKFHKYSFSFSIYVSDKRRTQKVFYTINLFTGSNIILAYILCVSSFCSCFLLM